MEPGELEAQIPVIVMRIDLYKIRLILSFPYCGFGRFESRGMKKYCNIQLGIADCLTRPAAWNNWFLRELGVKLVMSS